MAQRLSFFLHRQPHLSREAFQDYWRGTHAQLVAGRAETIGCVRYVQVHTALDAAAASPGGPEPFDGIAELWFDPARQSDDREARAQAGRDLLEDEAKFIDLERSPLWMGEEHVVIDGPAEGARLTLAVRFNEGLAREDGQRYWLETHGPLVRDRARLAGFTAYTQIHANADADTHPGRTARNAPPPFDGYVVIRLGEGEGTDEERAQAGREISEDTATFIDMSRSPSWLATEHVIVGDGA